MSERVVKCDVKVYLKFIERPIITITDGCLKLTWISGKFLVTTISHIQTNESLKTWTHADDNGLTNALLLAQKKPTHIHVRSFWHEYAFLLACELRCYRRALISNALFLMSPFWGSVASLCSDSFSSCTSFCFRYSLFLDRLCVYYV